MGIAYLRLRRGSAEYDNASGSSTTSTTQRCERGLPVRSRNTYVEHIFSQAQGPLLQLQRAQAASNSGIWYLCDLMTGPPWRACLREREQCLKGYVSVDRRANIRIRFNETSVEAVSQGHVQ